MRQYECENCGLIAYKTKEKPIFLHAFRYKMCEQIFQTKPPKGWKEYLAEIPDNEVLPKSWCYIE